MIDSSTSCEDRVKAAVRFYERMSPTQRKEMAIAALCTLLAGIDANSGYHLAGLALLFLDKGLFLELWDER